MNNHREVCAATLIAIAIGACSSAADATGATTSATNIPAVYAKFTSDVQVTVEGNTIVLRSTGVPNHKSPYFPTTDARYEAYNGTNANYAKAGNNSIVSQSYVFRIPMNPTKAATAAATPLGPIGISLAGVPFFNQYNGQNRPLSAEIDSFDQYNGHPTPTNEYHYHVEPLYLTKTVGSSVLLGFLLDGFPVYGPVENGKRMVNADLDALHGHVGVTVDYPNGIYHYHITDADPYVNGAGFYGTAGTVGR
ncbi:MAG: YHYH protein [Gemmatimonadota bacterium]